MVGLTFHFTSSKNNFHDAVNETINEKMKLPQGMENRTISKNQNYYLQFISYPEYPHYQFENSEILIFIEGKIYNKAENSIRNEISFLGENFFKNRTKDFEKIKNWIYNTDGDFVVLIYEKINNKFVIFNDFLGRLPIYYYNKNEDFVISRSLQYLTKFLNLSLLSKNEVANYLLFGHSLSDNTLYPEIKHLKPSSLIYSKTFEKNILIKQLNNFDFSEKNYYQTDYYKHVKNLADLFVEGNKLRSSETNKNIISLSGGLDSRLIASALKKANITFESVTLRDPWKFSSKSGSLEVKVAKDIARITESKITIIEGKLARGEDFLNLLNLKDGANHLGLSYLLRYLQDVQTMFGKKIVFFTGDGGQVVKFQPPIGNLKSDYDLLQYILKIVKRFSIKDVATLTEIKEKEIKDNLLEYFSTYPERNYKEKYIHFIFNERVNNWLFEGEDRNRQYFWSVTPFYSLNFFRTSMQTPDKLKRRFKLYIDLFNQILPEVNNIPYANMEWPINSWKSQMYLLFKEFYNILPENNRKLIKRVLNKEQKLNSKDNITIQLLKETVNSNKEILSPYLSTSRLLENNNYNSAELKMLLNLLLTIEHFTNKTSILYEYFSKEFSFR